jgi:hypothetical protein
MLALLLAAAATSAPVSFSAVLGNGSAHVVIRFSGEGSDVQVTLRGEDGLSVQGDPVPVRGRAVSRGEKITLDVSFAPGPARSSLVVEVAGKFKGEQRTSAQSFFTGMPTDGQRRKARERATEPLKGIPIER